MADPVMSLMLSIFGIMGGKLLDKFGPKRLMIGSGMAYNPSITTASRWFPDKKGMASAVKQSSGSYNMAFTVAGGFAAIAFALVIIIYLMSKKK